MRVTLNGTRLVNDWRTGMVASGAKPFRTSALLPKPRIVWNGNPFCEPGCVLYLPGIEGTGSTIYDYSGQKNNGAITGATWARLPSGLGYLGFDGTDNIITVPNNAVFNFGTSDFSIEAWVNVDSFTATHTFLGMGVWNVSGFDIWSNTDGSLQLSIFNNGRSRAYTAANAITAGTWAHIVARKIVTGTWFVNGVSISVTSEILLAPLTTTADLKVGLGTGNYLIYKGLIALPRIYNRALSALEIQNHFNQERHLFSV